MVGQWLAINAPERIDRLVVDLHRRVHARPPPVAGARAARSAAPARPSVIADAVVVAHWFTDGFAAAHPDAVAGSPAMIGATDPRATRRAARRSPRMDLRAGLAAITAPTLVIAGAQDRAMPAGIRPS